MARFQMLSIADNSIYRLYKGSISGADIVLIRVQG